MPRHALAPISGNIPYRKELSLYKRGVVIGYTSGGATVPQIAIVLSLPKSTVWDTLINTPQQPQGFSIARIKHPLLYNNRDECTLLRIIQINPRITYGELALKAGIPVSQSTLYRILRKHHIKKWIAKKRPMLTHDSARAQLRWAIKHLAWERSRWSKII